jgi:hypothetical protein
VPLRTVEEWSRKNSFPGWVDTLLFVLESSGDALTIINERLPADKEPHS